MSSLALFHDDLWTVEGISLTAKEFSSVLSTLEKLSRGTLSMKQLAQFLLGLERVLTPSQAKCICEVIKASSCWGTLYGNGGENQATIVCTATSTSMSSWHLLCLMLTDSLKSK